MPVPNESRMVNFASFMLVLEPSTSALGVLGALGLPMCRRRV
jgi:hypothetical protein